jgi:hypothetical protein
MQQPSSDNRASAWKSLDPDCCDWCRFAGLAPADRANRGWREGMTLHEGMNRRDWRKPSRCPSSTPIWSIGEFRPRRIPIPRWTKTAKSDDNKQRNDFHGAKAGRIPLHRRVFCGADLRRHDLSLDQSRDSVSSAGNRDSDVCDNAQCRAGAVRTMLARRLDCGGVVRFREKELSIAATVYQGIQAPRLLQRKTSARDDYFAF